MPKGSLVRRRAIATAAVIAIGACFHSARAQTIVDEWAPVSVAPSPASKSVTIDRKKTALPMLDFNQQACNPQRRPRYIA